MYFLYEKCKLKPACQEHRIRRGSQFINIYVNDSGHFRDGPHIVKLIRKQLINEHFRKYRN